MSSNIDSQKHQSARKIGNIFLIWKIHHYTLTSAESNCRITSPIFYARGHQTTTWQLILRPYAEENAKRHFAFRLYRLDNDSTASVVSAEWKIALMSIQEYLLCAKTGRSLFDGKSWYESSVSDAAANIYERLNSFKSDTLLLYFQLIVSHREGNNRIEGTSDVGLKSLSRDLFALYKRGRHSDVAIRIIDKCIPAHKAILQCRSPYFKDFIDQYRNKNVLDIKEFSYGTVNRMLSYLYSGKLEFVLGKPTIAMYECAVRFQIDEVKRYYTLDQFPIESKIEVGEMYDVWHIKNFKTRVGHYIQSQIFTERVYNVAMCLRLYPKGEDGKCNSVSVLVQFHCAVGKRYIFSLELGIIKRNKKLDSISKGTAVVGNNAIVDFCDWPYSDVNSNVVFTGTLSIAIKLQVCDTVATWKNFGTPYLHPFSNPNETEHSYSRLSNDLKSLFTSSAFSDITFVSGCMDLELHKCILVARSRTFSKQITKWRTAYLSCKAMDKKPDMICILMNYLYSGILRNFNLSDVSEIYDVADEYLLPILKVIASRIVQNSLTVENVSDFLLFAEKKKDRELKLSALKFICVNSPAVLAQQNFQEIKTSHPFLYSEAHEFARNDYSAFTSSNTTQILPESLFLDRLNAQHN